MNQSLILLLKAETSSSVFNTMNKSQDINRQTLINQHNKKGMQILPFAFLPYLLLSVGLLIVNWMEGQLCNKEKKCIYNAGGY